ncbi:hypothetical protein FNO01nite_22840 [Flavobacterium noncentrifugens]|uniref:Mevalonate kinase n=1 Tax=Flavobacterium noncentrifugens TaxID=1128970 RepID=A0A1G9AWS8_9FLAO|nr:GYDIA family GHMP kinase [Flavobacterium noncentrifugens]GEP51612.1 hypothetical protein FNO01nite_22840 [Flavobacterium noncentrifugens]SDK31769.1 Mevalonate kinase [Flavobacterium noncentrifugens]
MAELSEANILILNSFNLKTFYSNGKLLITGEYVVLDGAKALALPTKFGQDLVVENGFGKEIRWKSFDSDGSIWFEEVISFEAIANKSEDKNPIKNTIIEILHEAYLLNPKFLKSEGYSVTTNLTFPRSWGLGTSSTLINNIAQWLKIDAFALLKNSFGGSGYDIACAQNDTPILYHLENENPIVESVRFAPEFASNLYFIYLNKKQSSKSAIQSYREKTNNISQTIIAIDEMTSGILKAETLSEFKKLIQRHEAILSAILELPTAQSSLFLDFNGTIKSLGGWGGDFILAASEIDPTIYFKQKGYETVIPYSKMIL